MLPGASCQTGACQPRGGGGGHSVVTTSCVTHSVLTIHLVWSLYLVTSPGAGGASSLSCHRRSGGRSHSRPPGSTETHLHCELPPRATQIQLKTTEKWPLGAVSQSSVRTSTRDIERGPTSKCQNTERKVNKTNQNRSFSIMACPLDPMTAKKPSEL